jgi:hypothetical protein
VCAVLCIVLGKATAKTHILPIVVQLLEEEAIEVRTLSHSRFAILLQSRNISAQVRIAVVEELPELVKVVGGDALTAAQSLSVLAQDV